MPHGLSGIVSVSIGAYLVFRHSLVGDLRPYTLDDHPLNGGGGTRMPMTVLAYALSTIWNALGGLRIAGNAPPNSRGTFRQCAILQLCLSYFVLRFLPHTSRCLSEHIATSDTLRVCVRAMDGLVTSTLVLCTLSFFEAVIDLSRTSVILGQSIGAGIIGILLLSVYPLQLTILGEEEWWRCVQSRYPLLAAGMVAYIYVPATMTFSLILFGATLYQRKIIGPNAFGASTLAVVCVCLLSTVLSQEVHVPDVSTQRIYLPCADPPEGTFERRVVMALDVLRYARRFLTGAFGIEFE